MPEDTPLLEPALAAPPLLPVGRTGTIAAAAFAMLIGLGALGSGGFTPVRQGDTVSGSDVNRLMDGFLHGRGALLPVDFTTERDRSELLPFLRMPTPQAERLLAMADRGERAIGWLSLWDNYDEDGDVVSVTAGGFTQIVPLTHTPTRVLVPYIPGQPVLVTGEHDGMGGGVTVAVELSTGPLPLPPLAVGQTVMLPIQ